MIAPLPNDEAERLRVLRAHNILDTAPAQEFDDLVRLVAHACGTPIAAVSLIDEQRQWFKASTGLAVTETPRADAFCARTILQTELMIVHDAQADERFADNPLVTGDPHIRFYAGMPLTTEDGHALGSLCVIDLVPRTLTSEQEETLRLLARQVSSQLRAARRIAAQERLIAEKECLIAERQSVEAERLRLAAIVESSGEAIIGGALDGTIISWNQAAERLYGYSATEMIGRHSSALAQENEKMLGPGIVVRLTRGEAVENMEVVRARKDGSLVAVSLSFSPIRDAGGHMVGVSCLSRDITERKRAEAALAESSARLQESNAALAESEARLRRLTDAAFEGIAVSQDGFLVDVSAAYAAMFGYDSAAQMQGLAVTGLAAPDSRTTLAQKVAEGSEEPYEAALQRQDGSTFQAEVRGRLTQLGGRPARVTAVNDITQRKSMERDLQESQAFLEAVSDNSASLIYVFDVDTGTNIYANRGLAEFWGYSPGEIQAMGGELMARIIHPDDAAFMRNHGNNFAHLPEGEVMEFEMRCRHADGGWR